MGSVLVIEVHCVGAVVSPVSDSEFGWLRAARGVMEYLVLVRYDGEVALSDDAEISCEYVVCVSVMPSMVVEVSEGVRKWAEEPIGVTMTLCDGSASV